MSVLVTLLSLVYFGVMLMIGGAVQMIHAFKGIGWKGILPSVITGLLYLVAGFSVIRSKLIASSLLTLLLAGALIAIGFMRVWMAIQHRATRHWIWPFVGGLATVLFGLIILARWPVSGTWVIGLIINGWSCIALALADRAVAAKANEGELGNP